MDKWSTKTGKVEIEIQCDESEPEIAEVIKAMNVVFLSPEEPLTKVVPDFWQSWVAKRASQNETPSIEQTAQGPIARVGKGVSPPRVTYQPDPEYRDLARKAGYQAVVVLWLIVDAKGLPQNIKVARPAGMGLDEQAVDVVRTWKFDPAKKDGSPVAVQINVEMQFRLY